VTSREAILQALRRAAPTPVPAPEHPRPVVQGDPVARFLESVKTVGGTSYRVPDLAALDEALGQLPIWGGKKVVSLVPGAGRSAVDLAAVADPHELADLDAAAIPGDLGVAENGAVWIPERNLGRHRAVFVIPEHLVLVVRAGDVVNDMQAAYERIRVEHPGYGLFLSGPSKTADIEQSLVIGAHGARSCAVFVVG
jgi:L-lactate dehydrogenase complex protein LldG